MCLCVLTWSNPDVAKVVRLCTSALLATSPSKVSAMPSSWKHPVSHTCSTGDGMLQQVPCLGPVPGAGAWRRVWASVLPSLYPVAHGTSFRTDAAPLVTALLLNHL